MFYALLILISAVMGNLTPTHRRFDYIMTVIMPLAFFCTMFVGGFLDESDLQSRFSFHRAVEVAFQPVALSYYIVMALVTFLASFEQYRILKRIKKRRES